MKILFVVFFFIQIMTLNIAMADSKKDEALFRALTAAFPTALQFSGHYTQEISVENLQCIPIKNSNNFDCRARDNDSKEMIAKETDTLLKALNTLKSVKIAEKKSHSAAVSFSIISCSMNSERTNNGGQQQLFKCSFER